MKLVTVLAIASVAIFSVSLALPRPDGEWQVWDEDEYGTYGWDNETYGWGNGTYGWDNGTYGWNDSEVAGRNGDDVPWKNHEGTYGNEGIRKDPEPH